VDPFVKEYSPKGHLHFHPYLALIGIPVRHLEGSTPPTLEINNSEGIGRVLTKGQIIVAEAGYLAAFIREPVRFKFILGLTFQADPGPAGGKI
jgi:hypothetical protein